MPLAEIAVWLLPLAVWRLSYMLVSEAGPFEIFEALRYHVRDNAVGSLLACVYCTSVWVAGFALLAVHTIAGQWVIVWLALSALAILFHEIVGVLRQ